MSRELRRVPLGWQHPSTLVWRIDSPYAREHANDGGYCSSPNDSDRPGYALDGFMRLMLKREFHPMYDRTYAEAYAEWQKELADYPADVERWKAEGYDIEPPPSAPDAAFYRPDWGDLPLGYQVYQTVSEGTPVSPPFATLDELAEWMATTQNNGMGISGHAAMTVEQARKWLERGWSITMVSGPGVAGGVAGGVEHDIERMP